MLRELSSTTCLFASIPLSQISYVPMSEDSTGSVSSILGELF